MSRITSFTLCTLIFVSNPAFTQTRVADPEADRIIIFSKAAENQYVNSMLGQIVNRQNGQLAGLEQLMGLLGNSFGSNGEFTPPLAYREAMKLQKSQLRAQIIGQIITADLNNDGDVDKSELKAMLKFDQNNVAAAAFFSSDADENGILSAAEIREAAAMPERKMASRSNRAPDYFASIFDFDDDGILTEEEFERVKAALGL